MVRKAVPPPLTLPQGCKNVETLPQEAPALCEDQDLPTPTQRLLLFPGLHTIPFLARFLSPSLSPSFPPSFLPLANSDEPQALGI